MFPSLCSSLRNNCPLLYDIVEKLLLTRQDGKIQGGIRVHSALAILSSLRSQKLKNEFKLLFSLLCLSYGDGMRFINMLNHLGLTVVWKTLMELLDLRMVKMQDNIKRLTQEDIAIFLLMDNINIYKGKRRHLRIFKQVVPCMWNFTGRAIIIPHMSQKTVNLLSREDQVLKSQKDVLTLKPDDILYSTDNDQDKVFDNFVDLYILACMDNAI